MYKKLIFILIIGITISCNAQKQNSFSDIEGKWLTELNSNDIGLAKTVFTFEIEDSTFTAHTRKKATNDILGFWKSTLAKIFTSDFKHGSLLNITDGIIEKKNDTLILRGIFKSAMGNYYFNMFTVCLKSL